MLAAAQLAELQACEVHLAAKERELVIKRCTAICDGLRLGVRAGGVGPSQVRTYFTESLWMFHKSKTFFP
jgi:hypothetical protein